MKVLLTGATGFLGFRTLETLVLCNEIEKIIATGRSLKKTHEVKNSKVFYQLGDLNNPEFINSLVNQVDVIIHAAALSSPWGKEQDFVNANVIPQKLLIESAIKHKLQRYIYISTPSMYFDFTNRLMVKESDPLPIKFVNQYSKTKRDAEILLENSPLTYIILRPRALTGRGDTVIMPRLIRAFDEGKLKIIGNGKSLADLTSVENVADAILLSLFAEGNALNQTYNITNGEPVELWKMIELVLSKLGKQMNQKKIPYGLVYSVAQLMEWKSRMTNYKEPALTKYGVGTLAKTITMDISKAKKLLGYEPKVSTEEAINEFVNWYQNYERS